MAISATLEIREPGGDLLTQKLLDVYTVLDLDYTIERSLDKTGRPSGGASISFIKVTIRATKEKKAPFHDWIKGDDKLMDGEIKIFDSTGILSSTFQDTIGIDPLIDVGETVDIPSDMLGGAMGAGMDNASKYGSDNIDMFDEMSHADLVKYATNNDVSINSSDSDEVIRGKIRKKKKIDTEVEAMTTDELAKYIDNNKLTKPSSTSDYKKVVKKHKMEKSSYSEKEEEKDKLGEVENRSFDPAYKAADRLKDKTVSTTKGLVGSAVKAAVECARCIYFQNAYCISLKESFVNNPGHDGKLDSSYPWTLEIGIKPQKITVTGELFFGKISTRLGGSQTEFTLY